MKTPIQLSVPTPCHENWDKMTSADKGRFCAMCQKNVHDFTRSSDREIAKVMNGEDDVCGRFLPSQLDRDLYIPKEKKPSWGIAAAVSFLTLGATGMAAQAPVQTEQCPKSNEALIGKVAMPSQLVTGKVTDAVGPLPGVAVTIEGSSATAQTDLDGNYSINARPGFTLVYSFPGYNTEKRTVDSQAGRIDIVLKEEQMLDEVVIDTYRTTKNPAVLGMIYVTTTTSIEQKRTFLGRIFHSIGNLFR